VHNLYISTLVTGLCVCVVYLQVSEPVLAADVRTAALFSLSKMAQGGMYDHLGGGFHRYR
jgi:uncharacterized protein YyaL (SSP411 family)